MQSALLAVVLTAGLAGSAAAASAQVFNSATTEMPGEVYDTDGEGHVVSAKLGYMSPPHVYWSEDYGTSWVRLTGPSSIGLHHDPFEIHLRRDNLITMHVYVGEWGPTSPWNNTPILHWSEHMTWTSNLGETWGEWDSSPPLPAAARDWQFYE